MWFLLINGNSLAESANVSPRPKNSECSPKLVTTLSTIRRPLWLVDFGKGMVAASQAQHDKQQLVIPGHEISSAKRVETVTSAQFVHPRRHIQNPDTPGRKRYCSDIVDVEVVTCVQVVDLSPVEHNTVNSRSWFLL